MDRRLTSETGREMGGLADGTVTAVKTVGEVKRVVADGVTTLVIDDDCKRDDGGWYEDNRERWQGKGEEDEPRP
jgi:hypothetical protein